MTEQVDIVGNLINVAPVVAVLVYFIIYFKKKEKESADKIESLTNELRTSEKEAITVIKDLTVTLKDLINEIKGR